MDQAMLMRKIPSIMIPLLILLPNLLLLALPPRNIPRGAGAVKLIFDIMEKAGRLAIFVIPLFYTVRLNRLELPDRLALGGMLITLVLYYSGWMRFFQSGRDYALLFCPMLSVPVPMAVFPVAYFAFSALLLRSLPLLAATLVFAAGHIPFAYFEYVKIK